MGIFESIAEHYREGGFWMIPISCFQGVSLRAHDRAYLCALLQDAPQQGSRPRRSARAHLRGDVMGAIRFLSDQPQSPLTRILKAASSRPATAKKKFKPRWTRPPCTRCPISRSAPVTSR